MKPIKRLQFEYSSTNQACAVTQNPISLCEKWGFDNQSIVPSIRGSRLQGEIYSKSFIYSRIRPCEELGMVLYKDISLTGGGIIYEKLPQRALVSNSYEEGNF
jgi:hypothetical protein